MEKQEHLDMCEDFKTSKSNTKCAHREGPDHRKDRNMTTLAALEVDRRNASDSSSGKVAKVKARQCLLYLPQAKNSS